MKFLVLPALLIMSMSFVGCIKAAKKKASDSLGDVLIKPFSGSFSKCVSIGSVHGTDWPGSSSLMLEIVINSSGAFQHYRTYFTGASCSGVNPISYTQTGTIQIGAASTSVSGGYEVEFHSNHTSVTVRNQSSGTPFLTNFTAAYTGLVFSGNTAINPSANWSSGTTEVWDDFSGASNISYNVFQVSGSALSIHSPLDWDMGDVSTPTSVNLILTK